MDEQTSLLPQQIDNLVLNAFMGVTFGTLIGCVLALAFAVGIYLLQTNVVMLPDNDTFTYASLNGMVYGALAGLAFGFLETWRQNSPSAH